MSRNGCEQSTISCVPCPKVAVQVASEYQSGGDPLCYKDRRCLTALRVEVGYELERHSGGIVAEFSKRLVPQWILPSSCPCAASIEWSDGASPRVG